MTGRFASRKRWIILTAFAVDFATDAPCFAGASDGATDRAYGGSVRGGIAPHKPQRPIPKMTAFGDSPTGPRLNNGTKSYDAPNHHDSP